MGNIVYGSGAMRSRASAALVGPGPLTTQQIAVDGRLIGSMRAVVGSMKQRGSAAVAT